MLVLAFGHIRITFCDCNQCLQWEVGGGCVGEVKKKVQRWNVIIAYSNVLQFLSSFAISCLWFVHSNTCIWLCRLHLQMFHRILHANDSPIFFFISMYHSLLKSSERDKYYFFFICFCKIAMKNLMNSLLNLLLVYSMCTSF